MREATPPPKVRGTRLRQGRRSVGGRLFHSVDGRERSGRSPARPRDPTPNSPLVLGFFPNARFWLYVSL
jgi:hypothetical protein